jgi:hypothetical protein
MNRERVSLDINTAFSQCAREPVARPLGTVSHSGFEKFPIVFLQRFQDAPHLAWANQQNGFHTIENAH